MKRVLLLAILAMLSLPSFGWGQKGHDVTAYIAECNLKNRVRNKVTNILGGHSLVYYANWLDNASHTPEYEYTRTWHYANVDEGFTYETMDKLPEGDVITAIEDLTAKLKAGNLEPEKEKLYLMMLIHLVGDMHCPMHAGHRTDRGGNSVQIKFFNSPRKLHGIWDTDLVEAAHKWGYVDWQYQIDRSSKATKRHIAEGTPEKWFNETHAIATQIYADTPEGTVVSYDYIAKYTPVIEDRLMRGGIRLAKLLNDIYG